MYLYIKINTNYIKLFQITNNNQLLDIIIQKTTEWICMV